MRPTRGGALSGSAFVSLVYNAALLVVFVFLYDLIARYFRQQSLGFKLLTGLVLGLISVAVMIAAWRMPSGVIFDTRSVVLSVGALFYGTIPGMIAGAIAAVYRVSEGGPGTVMGVSVIAMSVVVGASWRRWRRIGTRDPGVLELYLFGLTVHACMLLLTFTLPDPVPTLRQIAVPVIVIYPLAAVLLGILMIDQRRRHRSERALRASERRFAAFATHLPGRLWIRDRDLRYLYVNPQLAGDLGGSEADFVGKTPGELWHREAAEAAEALCERALGGEVVDVVERRPNEGGADFFRSLVFAVAADEDAGMLGGLMFDVTEQHAAQEELSRHAQQLDRIVQGSVLAMSRVVETRDPYTAGHERRVAELAVAIAAEMGMATADLDGLRTAALIHDIGKIAVPSEILSKPGKLSTVEFSLIQQHAQAGFDILEAIDFEQPVAQMVLQHHERLDGSGYPHGLKDAAVIPEARIIAVADVVEAMASHRPYREALGIDQALAEIRANAGLKYDAEIAAVCERVFAEGFTFGD